MSAFHDAVRRCEEHLVNSWPSLRMVLCDGWMFREANGYTKRANSACAFDVRAPFPRTLDQAERFYASCGGPTVFRLTPLAGTDADRMLAERGYDSADETIVMTTPLAGAYGIDPSVSLASHCLPEWEDGYAAAHALPADTQRAHRAILDRIAPLPTAFATVHEGGLPIAFGLGVVERGSLGIFDIVTMPQARRRGAARKLVTALMQWGSDRDAHAAWLSVIADNEPAKPLYAQLGFRELYRYHYRVAKRRERQSQ